MDGEGMSTHSTHAWDDACDPDGCPRCLWCDCRPYGETADEPCKYAPVRAEADTDTERHFVIT